MKKLFVVAAAIFLSACSAVTITDGSISNEEGVFSACRVRISDSFNGTITYTSNLCGEIIIEQTDDESEQTE